MRVRRRAGPSAARGFPLEPPGVASAFVSLAAALTALHRGGVLTGVPRDASFPTRAFAELIAASEAALLAAFPCLALIVLRRWPVIAAAIASAVIAALAAGLYVDTKVLVFFGGGQVIVESLRAKGVLAHAGIPRAAIAVLAAGTLGCLALAFVTLRMLVTRATPRIERAACAAAIPLLGFSGATAYWTRFASDLDHDEREVRSRTIVGSAMNDAFTSGRYHLWRPLRYPRAEFPALVRPNIRPDILLVVVESLRASALTPEIMPLTYAATARGLRAMRHYSGGNCTPLGMFALLYGTNVAPYRAMRSGRVHSYPLTWLKTQGYRLEVFSGESLQWEEMDRTFFDVFDEVHQPPNYQFTVDQDIVAARGAADAFTAQDGPPRLVVLLLNATHFNYEYPAEFERFRPAAPSLDVLRLGRPDDIRPLLNRYQNAVGFADSLIGRVLAAVEAHGRGQPIVVVTGDHGEEFLEHGVLAHETNLFDPQTRVPLVIWGLPGSTPGTSIDGPTGHEDVLPTVLHAMSPEVDLSYSGTGKPFAGDRGAPLLVGQCYSLTSFVAVTRAEKTWMSVRDGAVTWSETRATDDAPPSGARIPGNSAEIRAALAYFGGSQVAPAEWPCARFDVRAAVFYGCDSLVQHDEAEAICGLHGAQLAWFDDEAQYGALAGSMVGMIWPTRMWIGLSRREHGSAFTWASGGVPAFSQWGPGEPSARLLDDCVQTEMNERRTWKSIPCMSETGLAEAGFVCRGR
jgi:glucan phosphoethanolaminetransferase (alkaline phosphatase superfamily)